MNPQGSVILRGDLRGVVEEAFHQDALYIGGQVLPALPVPVRAAQYPVMKKAGANLLRRVVAKRGPNGNYARITRTYENDNYTCQEYGFETPVGDPDKKDVSRFFDLESSETRFAYRQVQLDHEIRTAAKIFDPSVFSLTTSATAYTEALAASFDVALDVDNAKQQIQIRGEDITSLTGVMSLNVFNRIRASTRLQNRVRGKASTDTQLTLDKQDVAAALGLKEILVGAAVYDTSKEGQAASLSNIWGNTYIWIGNIAKPSGPEDYFSGGVGFTLFWEEDASELVVVESYREEQTRSNIIRGRQHTAEKIVLAAGAQLLVTQYS